VKKTAYEDTIFVNKKLWINIKTYLHKLFFINPKINQSKPENHSQSFLPSPDDPAETVSEPWVKNSLTFRLSGLLQDIIQLGIS
jgi:hypothetical protein